MTWIIVKGMLISLAFAGLVVGWGLWIEKGSVTSEEDDVPPRDFYTRLRWSGQSQRAERCTGQGTTSVISEDRDASSVEDI